jgi:hypothetical protein
LGSSSNVNTPEATTPGDFGIAGNPEPAALGDAVGGTAVGVGSVDSGVAVAGAAVGVGDAGNAVDVGVGEDIGGIVGYDVGVGRGVLVTAGASAAGAVAVACGASEGSEVAGVDSQPVTINVITNNRTRQDKTQNRDRIHFSLSFHISKSGQPPQDTFQADGIAA